jgi:hypothetical protein
MTDKIDAAVAVAETTTDVPTIKVTFHAKDSAAFEVEYAGISPAMFAAFASWCNYMTTKSYAERDYAEAIRAQATSKIIPATVMPGGRN